LVKALVAPMHIPSIMCTGEPGSIPGADKLDFTSLTSVPGVGKLGAISM